MCTLNPRPPTLPYQVTGNDTSSVEGILADAASQSEPPLVTLIVYDLPNRDCHAKVLVACAIRNPPHFGQTRTARSTKSEINLKATTPHT